MSEQLVKSARALSDAVSRLRFKPPVAYVYNPLDYAWAAHEMFLGKFGGGRKRVLLLGMNPGPFGMAQTGVPFGEVAAVRDWMGIYTLVAQPKRAHPKRPIEGFACPRSEVSGRRLWGLFAAKFGTAEKCFEDHFVVNFCPLVFMDEGGRNVTPDKLASAEREKLFALCDEHLRQVVAITRPEWVIGVGDFAEKRAKEALGESAACFGRILHPSPASPAANRGWAEAAERQLRELGVWEGGKVISD
ncbi:MAG: single-stranded DNA-binding protein [Verrucomicrobia bacterium]|nr:single-stranded DNA-binding protein [Verrucomicrobiota bacterium]